MITNPKQVSIYHALVLGDCSFLSDFLDLKFELCEDAVQAFKEMSEFFVRQIARFPLEADATKRDYDSYELKIVHALEFLSSGHGDEKVENSYKKKLARIRYPANLSVVRDRPDNLGGH